MSWKRFQIILFAEQFLIKGWEIGILLLLPVLNIKGEISLFELAALSTSLSISQFGSSLISGFVLQKFGSRKMMVVSALLGILPWITLTTNPNFLVMIILYLSAGASSGLFETCGISMMAKSLGKGKRAEGLGNLAMMGDAGRILLTAGTTIIVAMLGVAYFSLINAFIGSVMLMVLVFVLTKYKLNIDSEVVEIKRSSHIPAYFKDKQLVLALVVGWLDSFSSASLFIFLPLLFASKGLPFQESGFLSILLFVGYMMGRKTLGRLSDKIGTIKTLMVGETLMALIILTIILINNFIVLIFLLLLLGMATRGTSPVCKALVADSIPDHLAMENGVSIYQSGARLASIASRPIFSGVVGIAGVSGVFVISAISALLINVPLIQKRN